MRPDLSSVLSPAYHERVADTHQAQAQSRREQLNRLLERRRATPLERLGVLLASLADAPLGAGLGELLSQNLAEVNRNRGAMRPARRRQLFDEAAALDHRSQAHLQYAQLLESLFSRRSNP